MTPYEKQFPTQGDLTREQLRRRGFPFFGDVQTDLGRRLERMPPAARAAFAVACAERAMRWHEGLPAPDQQAFTLGWRPVLDAIWRGLAGRDEDDARRVRDALGEFHASPYDDGPDSPEEANEDAANASIFAAECFVGGDAESAKWAAARAVDLAFLIADNELQHDHYDFVWDPAAEPSPFAKSAMHPAVQGELRRQIADIERLERHGVNEDVLNALRAAAG